MCGQSPPDGGKSSTGGAWLTRLFTGLGSLICLYLMFSVILQGA